MSGKLLRLKKQIKSIKNTAKITKAMELVAASKMKNFQRKTINIRNFVFDLFCIFHDRPTLSANSIFVKKRKVGKIAFILYSSDKGLCGSLNQKLIKSLLCSQIWLQTHSSQRIIMTIGKKAADFCRFNGIDVHYAFDTTPEDLDSYTAIGFVEKIIEVWTGPEIKEIYMVAPHYKNSLIFYPLVKQFLPLSMHTIKSHMDVDPENINNKIGNKKMNQNILIDSDPIEVMEELTFMMTKLLFMHAFYELKASEYSSRMVAMKNATDSAKKMTRKKILQLNKERQTVITQQISEIVSGSI